MLTKDDLREILASLESDLENVDRSRGEMRTLERRITAITAALTVLISAMIEAAPERVGE